jgi:hypothetical protein
MKKVIIYLAGQPMFTEATDEELAAFRKMIARSAYVSWSISIVGDDEYKQACIDRENRVVQNFAAFSKRKKWYQIF